MGAVGYHESSAQDPRRAARSAKRTRRLPRFAKGILYVPLRLTGRHSPTARKSRPRAGGRGESHPPAPSEPDVSLSTHPAPIIQRQGSTPMCQWAKRAGERRATPSSHLHDRLG